MKKEILVPVITSTTESLISWMNEQVRTMNLMVDQLYSQHERIEELKKEKADYPIERQKRARAIEERQARYQVQCEKLAELEIEAKKLPFFDFKRRIKLGYELKFEREKLVSMRTALLRAGYIINKKDDHFEHIDVEIETVLVPNYKNHLAKFYGAYRRYNEYAKKFQMLTGIEIPEIEVDKVILYNGEKGELPVVNVDYGIPRLELELAYDDFDEFEDDNRL